MTANDRRAIDIAEDDLPLHCPTPEMSIWDSHPKVYLPIEESENGEEVCPYCGTPFILKREEAKAD